MIVSILKKLHLLDNLVGRVLPSLIAALAEGDFGALPAKIYWALKGRKIVVGAIGWGLAEILYKLVDGGGCLQLWVGACDQIRPVAYWVATIMGYLTVAGLADAAVHYEPPQKPEAASR